MNSDGKYDFLLGELLLINKPLNWTSFDVVNKIRYAITHRLNIKKIKVGHAGTLDPLADGLLIICTGKKTKSLESFMRLEKTYSGTITLGATTPSFDLETKINQTFDLVDITEEQIRESAAKMIGEIHQVPPIFSAKKVHGKKAYDFARKGEAVELKSNRITLKKFKITSVKIPEVDFLIQCTKGTYVRSIANDLGKSLNNGGYLSKLRREKIGGFNLENAHQIDELIDIIQHSDLIKIDGNF